jgi:hypothetical protein
MALAEFCRGIASPDGKSRKQTALFIAINSEFMPQNL